MENTIVITGVRFNKSFKNANDIVVKNVSLYLDSPIERFEDKDGERVLTQTTEFVIKFKEFLALVAKASWLAYVKPNQVDDDSLAYDKWATKAYGDVAQLLSGAVVKLERDENKVVVYSDVEKRDENGEVLTNSDGEILYEEMRDDKGDVVTRTASFGAPVFKSVKLTAEATEIAKFKAMKS